jgi:predicted nucleic acid-binding protein
MGKKYLIDTNIIIDYTSNLLPEPVIDFVENLLENEFQISVISFIEVMGFNETDDKLAKLAHFLSFATVMPLDDLVTQSTIDLRRKMKIKLPDAIIASTALAYNLILVTRNSKDFDKIENLEVINPHLL